MGRLRLYQFPFRAASTEVVGKVAVDVAVDCTLFDICVEYEGIGHEIAFCF